jgi:hypothetical protein
MKRRRRQKKFTEPWMRPAETLLGNTEPLIGRFALPVIRDIADTSSGRVRRNAVKAYGIALFVGAILAAYKPPSP